MESKASIEERVATRINGEIGNDIKNLRRATVIVDECKASLLQIRDQLDIKSDQNHTRIKSVLDEQNVISKRFDVQREKLEQFSGKLENKIHESATIIASVKDDLDKHRRLKYLQRYLLIIQEIQKISNALAEVINTDRQEEMTNMYLLLYEDNDDENSVVGRLSRVNAPYLQSFAIRTAQHWYEQLTENLSKEFLAVMRAMRWGQKEVDQPLTFTPSNEDIEKAQMLAENLYAIKSPMPDRDDMVSITPSIIVEPLDIVVRLLLVPYRQRFTYHFMGLRQTNRLDKPEWFFTQILNWGKDAHRFVGSRFQLVAMKAGKLSYNIRLEFLRGLVQLSIEKLAMDIEDICQDEHLFAHLLDEILAFETELRETFGYPPSFPSAISVVTQPTYLLKWITLEECFCAEKMDTILQDESAWCHIDPTGDEDDMKIPKCADQFIRLLEAIKDRYYSLIRPGHQMQFLKLQLELIDNFRIRLVQLHSSGAVDTVAILNALHYITTVLREWGENVHYLHLHAALVGPNATEIMSVFDQPASELEHWTQELIKNLAAKAFNEVWAKSMPYRKDCWSTLEEPKPQEPFILSPSAGEMFQVLVTIIHSLERSLCLNYFTLILRIMAKRIDAYVLDSMILMTKFSAGGAAQLHYDMTRNLFPLFGQHIRRPDLLFKKIHDSVKLLNAKRDIALNVYQTLKRSSSSEQEKLEAIKAFGLLEFEPSACIEVLERRSDFKILQ